MAERPSGYVRNPHDFYVEPPWCIELLMAREELGHSLWDPTCGSGTISKTLLPLGYSVLNTDLILRGDHVDHELDFLTADLTDYHGQFETIVCNPPYKHAEAFARRALTIATRKVCLLCNIKFLTSQGRHDLFVNTPLKAVYIFSTRPTMPPGDRLDEPGIDKISGGSMDFCWVVWERGVTGRPEAQWLLKG